MANKARLQFRIAMLLWLMACAASFFGGWHWDQIANKPRVRFNSGIEILAGRTASFESNMAVTRMMVVDPTMADIAQETQSTFTITAKRKGTTRIQLWDRSMNETATYDVAVR